MKKLVIIISSLFLIACTTVQIYDTKFYCKLKVQPSIKRDTSSEGYEFKLTALQVKEECKF